MFAGNCNKFSDGKRSNQSVISNNNNSAIVMAYFHANPSISAEANILVGSVHRILIENKYHPFKLITFLQQFIVQLTRHDV